MRKVCRPCPLSRRSVRGCLPARETNRRSGFTLIELLVVIVILGMLVGLIVPAVMRAVGTAKEAAVSSEIQGLGQAMAAFKNSYGDFPPSRIVCSESGMYDATTLGITKGLGPRTLAALRRFWPRMDLRTDGSVPAIPGKNKFYDFNGNGINDSDPSSLTHWGKPYILSGPECLVFFLGGIPQSTGASEWSVTGFAKNPQNPFQNAETANNRTPPFHEFVSSRLLAYPAEFDSGFGSPSGFPAFLDSLGSYNYKTGDPTSDGAIPFYCYFSAYGGSGYDPDDVNMFERDSATNNDLKGAFVANNAATPTPGAVTMSGGMVSPAPNPYTASTPVPTAGDGSAVASTKPRVWINAQSFQIISAGRDRVFGLGGQYSANAEAKLPFLEVKKRNLPYTADSAQTADANNGMYPVTPALGGDARAREKDNLTNFSQGKLE